MIEKKEVKEILLSGEKLDHMTNDLDLVARFGVDLYMKNKDFIREKIRDNWFVIIEPMSGTLLASSDQLELFNNAKQKFPDRLFYSVGLLKENLMVYVGVE